MLTCMGADVDAIRSTGLRTGQIKSRSIGRRLGVVVLILTVAGPAGPLPARGCSPAANRHPGTVRGVVQGDLQLGAVGKG